MALQNILPYTPEAREKAKMTKSEKVFWEGIRKEQLHIRFYRQFPILDYIVDFYCKEIGLAIEIDGKSHQNRFLEDSHRQERIETLGVRFLRFTNKEVLEDLDNVLQELKNTIENLSK